ncbi:MAG: GntR family transcriptional regulator [Desulfobacterales bacterium]|nr:MAG: GntR family transcriptional regulator [Desulfobacterales bacterium]
MKIVDESNPIPKYLQISTWLKELIQTGRYKGGEKLPSEVQLSKMCGVNRNTLRQAVSELTAIGLLRKEKGTGTFVAAPAPPELRHKLERIESTTELMRDSGIAQDTKILEKRVEQANDEIAKALFLGSNNKVVVVRRVRAGDGTPYIYEESYLPYDLLKDIRNMDLTGSMYKIISEHFNIVLARCKQTISAVNLDAEIAKILELPTNAAGIFMESLTFDENSIPVEVLYSYHRGDKYKLEIELGRYHTKAGELNFKT